MCACVFSRACAFASEKRRGDCVCVCGCVYICIYMHLDTHICLDSQILTHALSTHIHTGRAIYEVIDV